MENLNSFQREIIRYLRDKKINKEMKLKSTQKLKDQLAVAMQNGNTREIQAIKKVLKRIEQS